MHELRMVFCTFPDLTAARQIGTSLVEKQLAACVNLIPGVESVYCWEGRVESSAEILAVFKTTVAVYGEFENELLRQHPYEVPEVVAVEPSAVSGNYLDWVRENVRHPH